MSSADAPWPSLPFAEWNDTRETLHRWTQIVGKIRLRHVPALNHSWQATLDLTARGLTTSLMPHGAALFQIDFDFVDHHLLIRSSDGADATMTLKARSVADFYDELMQTLEALGLAVRIHMKPNEIKDAIPFDKDEVHAAYDPEVVACWWRIVAQSACVLQKFRARFVGKASPVHFFWGSFDLTTTRFSGKRAPLHPGGLTNLPDRFAHEAYSHEVSGCGFWPGGSVASFPLFYANVYPEPAGFSSATVRPVAAFYHAATHQYVLPYDDVRNARSPETLLLEFMQSTYEAAANLGGWDRSLLERPREIESDMSELGPE
ncbi:MAG: hypothetical protein HY308_01670 [Gammaproteobacteria bacterium]|nr:hypothetical protein [Gammaproteobacteria bacterium]